MLATNLCLSTGSLVFQVWSDQKNQSHSIPMAHRGHDKGTLPIMATSCQKEKQRSKT